MPFALARLKQPARLKYQKVTPQAIRMDQVFLAKWRIALKQANFQHVMRVRCKKFGSAVFSNRRAATDQGQ